MLGHCGCVLVQGWVLGGSGGGKVGQVGGEEGRVKIVRKTVDGLEEGGAYTCKYVCLFAYARECVCVCVYLQGKG